MYITQLVRDQLALYLREDCMDFERLTLDGTLTLQNLEFKLDVLRDALDIPQTLEITRAFIRTLQVNVPWTNLTGQPISVKVDTVMIVLKLKTDEELQSTAEAASSNTTSSKTTDDTSNSSSGRPEPQPTERPSDSPNLNRTIHANLYRTEYLVLLLSTFEMNMYFDIPTQSIKTKQNKTTIGSTHYIVDFHFFFLFIYFLKFVKISSL